MPPPSSIAAPPNKKLEYFAKTYGIDALYYRASDKAVMPVKQLDFSTIYHSWGQCDMIPEEEKQAYSLALMLDIVTGHAAYQGASWCIPVGDWVLPADTDYDELSKRPMAHYFRE